MDATQMISDSILESDEDETEQQDGDERARPLAKLCILKNEHIPEKELPLFLGDNVLGRDPNTCTLQLPASSVSKQHATICISVYRGRGRHGEGHMEALVWDLGSMNGTRKGRLKLTPKVRYALSEGDSLVVADIPCQYVSCGKDSSQGDIKTLVSRNSGVQAWLPNASGEKGGGDTSTGSKKCVSEGTKARVSSKKTPVRASCLSFEQTPTQPQGTLVPESDSDSDSERRGGADGRRKVSDSDSHKSSPTCSTFLSPTNKVVPESEDESPITPASCCTKNRTYRHDNFTTEETDLDVGRQQLEKKKVLAIVDDSEEEEERAAQGGTKSKDSGQHVPVEQECNVSLAGEDESSVSTPAVSTEAIPAFDMDSDTDMEGEEEGVVSEVPVTLNTNQHDVHPPKTLQFHMDSDTDIDEDDDVSDKTPKTLPSSNENTKPPHVISVIQPEGITMDSDTDVDDDDDDDDAAEAVSDVPTKAKPTSFQSAHTADSASSKQPKDFHLDSDTDVDDEEEAGEFGRKTKKSKTDETPNKLEIKLIVPESAPAAHHSLHLNSDTDDEAIPAPAISEPSAVAAVTESCTIADAGANLDLLSDSDTDVQDDSPLIIPVAVTTLSVSAGTASEALQPDSDAGTDVNESSVPPAGDGANPADLRVDSDTDVEDQEADIGEASEDQIPNLKRENTPGFLVPALQNCSTPVQLSEGDVENMETQAFTSPLGAFRRAVAPALRAEVLSSSSDSQENEDFLVAETQSFILQTRDRQSGEDPTQAFVLDSSGDKKDNQSSRGESLQLGLSDSSHLQCQNQALAMESTQSFVSVEGGVDLEDTQAYAVMSAAARTSAENDSNQEATQAYGQDEEQARCAVVSEKGQEDLALEATQAYISEPCSDPDDNTDEDETQNTATTETQASDFPTSSTLAMAETQLMVSFVGEEKLATDNPVCSGQQVKPRTENETEEREEHGKAAHPQERQLSEAQSIAETQPICMSDNEETDDEDLFPGLQKSLGKPLQLKQGQTQSLTCSVLPLGETQPMAACGDDESDDADLMPAPRKRKAKQLHLEGEETQQLSNSELSVAETQPMATWEDDDEDSMSGPRKRKAKPPLHEEEQTQPVNRSEVSADETQPLVTGEDEESDDEDSIPGPRKRRAKPLPLEETQSLTSSEVSAVETQPLGACEAEQSDEEDLISCPRKRKAKPLPVEEEQTQPLTSAEASAVETQPVVTGEHEESDDEDSRPGPRKRKAKQLQIEAEETQPLTNSDVSPVETQPLKTKTGLQPQKGKGSQSEAGTSGASVRRGTRASLREEEEQVECSEPLKRQTRGTSKSLSSTRGRRGRARPDDDNNEEEVRQAKRTRGQKSKGQQKKEEEEHERLELERNKHDVNKSQIGEQEGNLGEEKDGAELRQRERRKAEEERREADERQREEEEMQQRREEEERIRLELQRAERERKEKEEKDRLERERMEKEEKERLERERREQEDKESLETAKRELEERLERERREQERQARVEREEREKLEKEKDAKELQAKEEEKPKAAARGRRGARRTIAAQGTTEPERDSAVSANDDFPARRTRSRSNSSNSISSERSASSVNTQESKGTGRGRGAKRTSEPPQATIVRSSHRRTTLATGPTEHGSNGACPQGRLSTSNSSNSLNSEISSCSVSSQNRGRGGRQRGRGRKTEPDLDSIPPLRSQSDQNSIPKPAARGRQSRKTAASSGDVFHEDDKDKADSQQASTTRGRRRASANDSEPAATNEEDKSNQEEGCASVESLLPKRNVRGRGQKASKGIQKVQKTEAPEEEGKDEIPAHTQVKRGGRASSTPAKKNANKTPEVEVKESETMEGETVERRVRGRTSVVPRPKKEALEESGPSVTSVNRDANGEASEQPHTPTSTVCRKRQAPADSSPVAKTPRSSSASPAAIVRLRAASLAYKVLFTGVVDEAGERVLARLGGSMAKGVVDMNCLVTDKVRRTVKFLCAVAKGVPIVTTDWLEKSGKAGSFLSPNTFIVKDPEQEKKFNFCLQESLRIASSQPLLQGYEIHVTKSVKPEPVQMKDIISSSGATFLPKMPSSLKPQTVVISCEEDWPLCGPAVSASLPVVTAEFLLTGILQQKLDVQTHTLSPPTANLQPAGGRGRGRRKT